jgi:hypothetical protein
LSEIQWHDEAVVSLLRDDPALMADYLRVALNKLDKLGGEAALLIAMRHVIEALDDIEDIQAIERHLAGDEEMIPADVVDRLIDGKQ